MKRVDLEYYTWYNVFRAFGTNKRSARYNFVAKLGSSSSTIVLPMLHFQWEYDPRQHNDDARLANVGRFTKRSVNVGNDWQSSAKFCKSLAKVSVTIWRRRIGATLRQWTRWHHVDVIMWCRATSSQHYCVMWCITCIFRWEGIERVKDVARYCCVVRTVAGQAIRTNWMSCYQHLCDITHLSNSGDSAHRGRLSSPINTVIPRYLTISREFSGNWLMSNLHSHCNSLSR